ncbi:MAG: hypothetical protein H7235_07265 [Bdellovibrionaceae bacterium]|nr:hypothetical protein [Pseudobdellovibrionaceae bacterium]
MKILKCSYLNDIPNDFRILVTGDDGSECAFRVLGRSSDPNPDIELISSVNIIENQKAKALGDYAKAFHLGLDLQNLLMPLED